MDELIWTAVFVLAAYLWILLTIFIHEAAHAIVGKILGFEPIRVDVGCGKWRGHLRLFGLTWSFGLLPWDGTTFTRNQPATGLAWRGPLFTLGGPIATAGQLALLVYLFLRAPWPEANWMLLTLCFITGLILLRNVIPMTVSSTTGSGPNDGKAFWEYLTARTIQNKQISGQDRDSMVRRYDSTYESGSAGMTNAPEEVRRREELAVAAYLAQDWSMAVSTYLGLIDSGYLHDAEKATILDALACIPIYYGEMKWLAQAEEWTREACRLAPSSKTVRGTLGSILAERGKPGEAMELLGPLAAEGNDTTDRAVSSAYLAKIYSELGHQEKADEYLNQARNALTDGGDEMRGLEGVIDRIAGEIDKYRWRHRFAH